MRCEIATCGKPSSSPNTPCGDMKPTDPQPTVSTDDPGAVFPQVPRCRVLDDGKPSELCKCPQPTNEMYCSRDSGDAETIKPTDKGCDEPTDKFTVIIWRSFDARGVVRRIKTFGERKVLWNGGGRGREKLRNLGNEYLLRRLQAISSDRLG